MFKSVSLAENDNDTMCVLTLEIPITGMQLLLPTPTALRITAQGCPIRATLGIATHPKIPRRPAARGMAKKTAHRENARKMMRIHRRTSFVWESVMITPQSCWASHIFIGWVKLRGQSWKFGLLSKDIPVNTRARSVMSLLS